MQYQEKAKELKEKIKQYHQETNEWKLVKKAKDVTVFSRTSPEFSGHLYKAEGFVEARPERVYDFVNPNPDGPRAKWDKAVKSLEIVQHIDKMVKVVRTCTHSAAMGLISPRDFIDLCITDSTEDYLSTVAQSIEHTDSPADQTKYVRGTNYPCGITCFKVKDEPNRTRLVTFCHADLGGMLPQQLVKSALPGSMVDFFINLRQALEDEK